VVVATLGAGCASETGDPQVDRGAPPVSGRDKRIRDLMNPELEGHEQLVSQVQAVSGALVVAVDTFDETQNGRSAGTIYVQDIGSTEAYSGITLFAPSFIPGNLRVSPGDVLDLRGEYTEAKTIGPTVTFAPGAVLPQLSQPIATFRYETRSPEPVTIPLSDLTDFATGRRWMGMLVQIENVTLQDDATRGRESGGRLSVDLTPRVAGADNKCVAPFPKPPSLTNDLFDLGALDYKRGRVIKRLVGVVGFFCNLKIAPRSAADVEVAP